MGPASYLFFTATVLGTLDVIWASFGLAKKPERMSGSWNAPTSPVMPEDAPPALPLAVGHPVGLSGAFMGVEMLGKHRRRETKHDKHSSADERSH